MIPNSSTPPTQVAPGISAKRVKQIGTCDIWTKRLPDSSMAVSVINRGSRGEDVILRSRDIADFKTELPLRVEPYETILLDDLLSLSIRWLGVTEGDVHLPKTHTCPGGRCQGV